MRINLYLGSETNPVRTMHLDYLGDGVVLSSVWDRNMPDETKTSTRTFASESEAKKWMINQASTVLIEHPEVNVL